jgi:DNA repair exonuclease SbcCD ATPase subunit
MFSRLFGTEKKKEPAPSLDDVSARAQGRVSEMDEKIAKLDAEVRLAIFVFVLSSSLLH